MEKSKPSGSASKQTRNRIGIVLIALVAIALIAWLAFSGDDDSDNDSAAAEIVTVDSLRETSNAREIPIYWAGERQGTELELSQPDQSRTYVRYLTDGAKAGDSRPDFLTVGTYESPDPMTELRRQGKEGEGVLGKAPGGAVVYFDRSQPQSVYLAFPNVDAQIEVYDPNFKQALQLVNSGQIVPSD